MQTTLPFPQSSSFESLLPQLSPVIEISSLSNFIHIFVPQIFSMKACNLYNLDLLKTDFEISGLTSEVTCKFTTFFSVANPLILCAPPQMFVVAERTRSDLETSPTYSGFTTLKLKTSRQVKKLACRIFPSCIIFGYFSHLKLPCLAVAQSANPSIAPSSAQMTSE